MTPPENDSNKYPWNSDIREMNIGFLWDFVKKNSLTT